MTFPIVLAHGVCRFDQLWSQALGINNTHSVKLDKLHYFKNIRTALVQEGFSAFHSNVGWAANVDARAEDLRQSLSDIITRENCEKVNIIAHSMGGLDARHMMFNDRKKGRIHRQIASLTTISTPHAGSAFADWGIGKLGFFIRIAQKSGSDISGLMDLRTDRCQAFNRNPEVVHFEKTCEESILFQTYAGKQTFWPVFHILKFPFRIIKRLEGENDGLVSVESAKWREDYFKGVIEETDHLNELGWWSPDHMFCREGRKALQGRIKSLYLNIAMNLP